jgi:hypothetical protein
MLHHLRREMMSEPNLNFHQTFKPEAKYISSILSVSENDEAYDVKEISSLTGIPNGKSSGKVEPHIFYASYMGLINYQKINGKYTLELTPLGKTVKEEDPGLQEDLTILLCHLMLVRDVYGADVWNAVFKMVLPKYGGHVRKDIILKELEQVFPNKINNKNFAPFISSYDDIFKTLRLVDIDTEGVIEYPLIYNKEFIYLYAYTLFEYWDIKCLGMEEITSDQLQLLGFGKAFAWDETQEYEVLENLASKDIIRLNRQLMPYTILRLLSKNVVLKKLYSELC